MERRSAATTSYGNEFQTLITRTAKKMLSTIDTRLWHAQLESVSACGNIGNCNSPIKHLGGTARHNNALTAAQ